MSDRIETARKLVFEYAKAHLDKTDDVAFELGNVYVVWFCFILGGWKALVSTSLPDAMYYEVTHNVAKGETYLDAYRKTDNVCIPD